MWMVNRIKLEDGTYQVSDPYKIPCMRQLNEGEERFEIEDQPSLYHKVNEKCEWVIDKEEWLNLIVRPERNKLLQESDYTQLADYQDDKATWATYRQELRDLPLNIETGIAIYPESPNKENLNG